MNNKWTIQETIVVEGKSDVNKLAKLVNANFITTNGSACDLQTINLIKQANHHCGVILFLDPDFVGEKIRKKISQFLPTAKHAFIKTSDFATNQTKKGIAEADDDILLNALKKVVTLSANKESISLLDFNRLHINNKAIRQFICNHYQISYCNNKQLFKRLNMMGIDFIELKKLLTQWKH